MDADMLTVPIEGREVKFRRPTHAELDLGLLMRLLQVLASYREEMTRIEETGTGALRVAKLLGLCNESIDELRDRVRRFLARCAGAETAAWFEDGTEIDVARRSAAIATALVMLLAPPGRLGK
jgi:hypothetical protein